MTHAPSSRRRLTLTVLAIGQLASWGSVGLLAVGAVAIAPDIGISLPAAFVGNTVFYIAMALAAPLLAGSFIRHGAARVMILSAAVMAGGHLLLAASTEPMLYAVAWLALGLGGAGCLTTAATILLSETEGSGVAGTISGLMVVTGLSSTLFLPIGAALISYFGWRSTLLVYAGVMLAVAMLYAAVLPRMTGEVDFTASRRTGDNASLDGTFLLIAGSIALNGFVTFGLSAVLVELLKQMGAGLETAVATASVLGIVQVGARGIDLLSRGARSGLTSAIAATVLMLMSLLVLALGGIGQVGLIAFVVLYGIGSGMFAVSRATIPLAFYDRAAFARASSRIALPLNLMSATAAPALAWLMHRSGGLGVTLAAALLVATALALLMVLARRPRQ